jgi:hypothetical protein
VTHDRSSPQRGRGAGKWARSAPGFFIPQPDVPEIRRTAEPKDADRETIYIACPDTQRGYPRGPFMTAAVDSRDRKTLHRHLEER